MTHLVELVLGIGNHVTLQWSTSVRLSNFQCIECKDVAMGVLTEVLCLGTPTELTLCGQYLTGYVGINHLVHVGGITGVGITNDSQSLGNGLEHSEQWILLQRLSLGLGIHDLIVLLGQFGSQVVGLNSSGIDGCRIGSNGIIGSYTSLNSSILLVELSQQRINLLRIVSLPELQIGTTLQQLTNTLGLLDTRHFHHDTSTLSFELLDIWLYNAKLINTVADYIERVVNSRLNFCTQGTLHLGVGTASAHLALHLLSSKDGSQGTTIGVLLPILDKQGDEITLTGFLFLLSLFHRLLVGSICLVVSQYIDYIGY